MTDFVPRQCMKEQNSFHDYMKREDNYDLSCCDAWINYITTEQIDDAEKLFELFLKIQSTAMQHFERIGKTREGGTYPSGIYVGGSYCVSNHLVSDLEGIKELVSQIWFDKKNTLLTVYSEKKADGFHDIYLLANDGFYKRNPKLDRNFKIFSNDSSQETFNKIFQVIQTHYDIGLLPGGFSPLRIQSTYANKESKQEKAITLFRDYLISIKDLDSNEEKISKICYLCRELEQLLLFYDGSGRSVFILANLLARWRGLTPFYPLNICIFDANSLKTMVRELMAGQKRFAMMFGSQHQFTKNLNEYKITVQNLVELTNAKFSQSDAIAIMKFVKARNFNLLLRQSAARKNAKELLAFLLQNLSSLNIDINSKGEKSGTALEVAIKSGNKEAISLLKKYV